MSYADTAALAADQEFSARLVACVSKEAAGKPGDPLANQVLANTAYIPGWFMPLVSAAPGFDTKYAAGGQESITDGDLLSAVQASWSRVATIHGLAP
jgi:hypothetical protein